MTSRWTSGLIGLGIFVMVAAPALADGFPAGAKGLAGEGRAVFQGQEGGHAYGPGLCQNRVQRAFALARAA